MLSGVVHRAFLSNRQPRRRLTFIVEISVDATTAVGSYPIVITGMSGSLTHIVNVTLWSCSLRISVDHPPSSRSIAAGKRPKNYVVTPVAARGFSGDVV